MRYCNKLLTLPADNADNALYLGTAVHTCLEKGLDEGIKQYVSNYPVITDAHINEIIKLEIVVPKAIEMIPDGEFEVKISNDDFVGYIDLLAPVKGFHECEVPNLFDLYDFKYSNNVDNYRNSAQLHLYKYFFEKNNPGKKIRNLYFLFIPKVNIKQKKIEDLVQFRNRIQEDARKLEPKLVPVEYDPNKVIDFMFKVKHVHEAIEYPKEFGWLCNYCEYKDYCQKGIDYMLLPKNERRNIEKIEKKVIWIYGAPFCGKTTFANCFPDPLMLNTDGNIKFVDAPYLPIKDEITKSGRMTQRKFAWAVFKESIEELEKKENDFKSVIVDLLEDCYEHCRLYMYDKMGISHESDDSFKAWDKVTTEYLSTLKRLMNLDYENIILISHEDASKDITKKGGDKITSIKPNLRDKVANKVAGMVDIVARVVADGDVRTLSFKANEVVFGGGRLNVNIHEVPLDYDAFLAVYEEANKNAVSSMNGDTPKTSTNAATTKKGRSTRKTKEDVEKPVIEETKADSEETDVIDVEATEVTNEPAVETPEEKPVEATEEPKEVIEEKPVRRTRKKREE